MRGSHPSEAKVIVVVVVVIVVVVVVVVVIRAIDCSSVVSAGGLHSAAVLPQLLAIGRRTVLGYFSEFIEVRSLRCCSALLCFCFIVLSSVVVALLCFALLSSVVGSLLCFVAVS